MVIRLDEVSTKEDNWYCWNCEKPLVMGKVYTYISKALFRPVSLCKSCFEFLDVEN
jgi:hypothetical protein